MALGVLLTERKLLWQTTQALESTERRGTPFWDQFDQIKPLRGRSGFPGSLHSHAADYCHHPSADDRPNSDLVCFEKRERTAIQGLMRLALLQLALPLRA